MKQIEVPIEVSARHIHLCQKDLEVLFGENYHLSLKNDLSQPGQYAANETVTVIGPEKSIDVRIIGPVRKDTQLELSITDSYMLGIEVPEIKVSGDLDQSKGGVKLKGPNGEIKMQKGVIVAQRHLHIEPEKAKIIGLSNGDIIDIKVEGIRSLIYKNVIIRSHEGIDSMSFQIDTDEANAGAIDKNSKGWILRTENYE